MNNNYLKMESGVVGDDGGRLYRSAQEIRNERRSRFMQAYAHWREMDCSPDALLVTKVKAWDEYVEARERWIRG